MRIATEYDAARARELLYILFFKKYISVYMCYKILFNNELEETDIRKKKGKKFVATF